MIVKEPPKKVESGKVLAEAFLHLIVHFFIAGRPQGLLYGMRVRVRDALARAI